MTLSDSRLKKAVLAAVMAAILSGLSVLTFPIGPVPVTLQTLGVFLALGLLGGKWGSVSVALWLLLGALGVPVFSGFRGGIGVLIGNTGGYLFGFLLGALVFWALETKKKDSLLFTALGFLACLAVCYAAGTAWFAIVSSSGGTGKSVLEILSICVFPFLPVDLAKGALALVLVRLLKKRLPV